MTPELDQRIAAIKTRISAAQTARVRAEATRDAAAAAAQTARRQLAEEFGVASVAEATTMLATLEQELTAACSHLEAALDETGM